MIPPKVVATLVKLAMLSRDGDQAFSFRTYIHQRHFFGATGATAWRTKGESVRMLG
jgi:hypothetical protein